MGNDEHQDPAEQYRTDTAVETDDQPDPTDELAQKQADESSADVEVETTVTTSGGNESSDSSQS